MATTMWTVVVINLLSGVTMWPLPSTSNLPVSMYDMCTKTDLHQIEDLKNTLIEGFNESSINLDENGPSLSFGLLDEDWKRLLLLENIIPEESVLKSKLLVVFRILIAALYQAHGATLVNSGEQNITVTSDNEQNTIDDGERRSSSELDFGDFSSHDDGLDNSDIFDDDNSNESSGVSEFSPSIFTTSKYKPDPKAQTVTTFKTGDDANLDESSKNELLASTHITNAPTSNPRTSREPDETTMAATTVEMENKPNEKEDFTNLKDMPISPVMLNDYSEEETNTTTTEKSSLQQTHNQFGFEDTLTDDHTTSTATIMFTKPTIDIISPVSVMTTTHIFPFDYDDITDTINYFSDLTASNLYPEIVKLFIEKEGINNKSHGIILPHNTHEEQLNVSSSSGSWEDNQLFDDMVGSDSIINEVIVPESTYETSTIHQSAFSTDRGTTENQSHENEQSVKNESGYKTQTENTIKNHDSLPLEKGDNRIFNSGEMNQTTFHESTTESIQFNESKNEYEDTSRTNTHHSNINTYDTTSSIDNTSISSLNNLRDSVTKNNDTRTITLTSLDSNHLAPRNSFHDFWEHHTPSTDGVKESSATTTAGVSMSKPDNTMPSIFEITQKDKANVDEHVSSEKGYDTQRYEHNTSGESITLKTIIVERKSFNPTNDDDDDKDDDDVLYDGTTSVQFIPESSEFISSAENDDGQSSGVERQVLSPTNNDDGTTAERFVPESSEPVYSVKNESVHSITSVKDEISLTHDDDEFPTVQHVHKSPEHVSSEKNEHSQSSSVEQTFVIPINDESQPSSESSEHVSSAENENFQIIDTNENDDFSSTHDDHAVVVIGNFSERSKHVSSAEKGNVQSASIERDETSLTNEHDEVIHHFPESSEHDANAETESVQITSIEKDETSLTHLDDAVSALENIPESSEHVWSAENENVQSTSIEKDETSLTHEHDEIFGIHHFSESSEHDANVEKENVQITSIEEDETRLTHHDDVVSALENIPESSEHVSKAENENVQRSSIEKDETSLTHEDDAVLGIHYCPERSEHDSSAEKENVLITSIEKDEDSLTHEDDAFFVIHNFPESSEHDSSAEKENVQITSIEKDETSLTHEDDAVSALENVPESSEHVLSLENESLSIGIKENDNLSTTHGDEASYVQEGSEHVSSVENEHFQSSHVEKTFVSPINDDESSTLIQPLPRSSEQETSTEIENLQSSIIGKDKTGLTHDDDTIPAEQYVHESSEHVSFVEDEDSQISNAEQTDNVRKIFEPTGKVDYTVTDTDKGKESFRTFSVGFPKLLDNPLPTYSYNELKIYPKLSYTYQPSNMKLKISCQNGNDCVHVQNIEYMTSTDPLYKRLVKRDESKFESKTRDKSEINEDIPAHLISPLENLFWQDKLRKLKESAYE